MYIEDKENMEEDYPDDSYNKAEMKETMFMGTESKARRRFPGNSPYRPKRSSQDSRYDRSRRQSQYTGSRRDENCDWLQSNLSTTTQPPQIFPQCIKCQCTIQIETKVFHTADKSDAVVVQKCPMNTNFV